MDVFAQRFHAAGKFVRIDYDVAVRIAVDLPAVVDDEVFVAGIEHAGLHHGIGDFFDGVFIDATALKAVPAVPPHRWGLGQPVELLG